MSQCKPKTLFESDEINISTCMCCKRIGLQFKNMLHGFDRSDFERFAVCIEHIDFEQHAMSFPDGQRQVVVKTCHTDIQFCFTEKELSRLQIAIHQATLLMEVQATLEVI